MSNPSCRFLSNGYKFQIDSANNLNLMPCCMWRGDSLQVTGNLEDVDAYRARLNSVDAHTDPRCVGCQYQEKNNLRTSWRQKSFNFVPDNTADDESTWLELQLDTICNAGCIICGPWHSSFWQKELNNTIIPIKSSQKEIHMDLILKTVNLDQIRRILFLGGETFLTDTDTRILSLIKNPEQVVLQYTTNGSIFPTQERIDQWKQFKNTWITLSIDGIGNKFDYIRYPLTWTKVQDNIMKMLDTMPESVRFHINHTVNILNLYYYNEFDQWRSQYLSQDRYGREITFHYNPAVGSLSPRRVPSKLLELLKTKYAPDSRPLQTVAHTNFNQNTLVFLNEIDQRRELNWKTIFPEIANCF